MSSLNSLLFYITFGIYLTVDIHLISDYNKQHSTRLINIP